MGGCRDAATAGRTQISSDTENIFLTEFINAEAACKRADVVICNGGSPSCYLALAHDKPSLSLPVNLDQYLNAQLFADAGVSLTLRSGQLDLQKLRQSVQSLLTQSAIQQRASALSKRVYNHNASDTFQKVLNECIGQQ